MRVGAKVSLFNLHLRTARTKLGLTQKELADYIGVRLDVLQAVEQVRKPAVKAEDLKDILIKVSDALNVDFDVLFPSDYLMALNEGYLPGKRNIVIERDIDISSLPPSLDYLSLPSPEQEIEDEIVASQLRQKTFDLVGLLKPKQQEVIVRRYGLDGNEPMTLEEIGVELGCTRENVREIESNALRFFRHPERRREFNSVLDGLVV